MYRKIVSKIIAAIILILSIAFLVMPKFSYSERENRYLKTFPKFSFASLVDGSFVENLSEYLCDHFPKRDMWISINSNAAKLSGKKEVNNVYFAYDDYLIEKYESPTNLNRVAKVINKFTANIDKEVYFIAAPTSYEINLGRLPKGAYETAQIDDLKSFYSSLDCSCIDISTNLRKENKVNQVFYRLDHHWTLYGAYIAYEGFMNEIGEIPLSLDSFNIYTVCEDFRGTIFNKVGECNIGYDSIYAIDLSMYDIEYTNPNGMYNSIYDEEKLETADKYAYFMSGNFSYSTITNNSLDNERSLLLIKDSYANSMIPFLLCHYKNITVIDPRFYSDNISEIANEFDEVLFVYNMNTIGTDIGIRGVK